MLEVLHFFKFAAQTPPPGRGRPARATDSPHIFFPFSQKRTSSTSTLVPAMPDQYLLSASHNLKRSSKTSKLNEKGNNFSQLVTAKYEWNQGRLKACGLTVASIIFVARMLVFSRGKLYLMCDEFSSCVRYAFYIVQSFLLRTWYRSLRSVDYRANLIIFSEP